MCTYIFPDEPTSLFTTTTTTTTTTTAMTPNDLPTATLLLFTAACLIPAVIVAISHEWRGRETQAHAVLLRGLRMVALGCGYVVVGVVCVPVLGLHYVDKY
ncbi:hypothetical protein Hte_012537 [Hypoxylon texense]